MCSLRNSGVASHTGSGSLSCSIFKHNSQWLRYVTTFRIGVEVHLPPFQSNFIFQLGECPRDGRRSECIQSCLFNCTKRNEATQKSCFEKLSIHQVFEGRPGKHLPRNTGSALVAPAKSSAVRGEACSSSSLKSPRLTAILMAIVSQS